MGNKDGKPIEGGRGSQSNGSSTGGSGKSGKRKNDPHHSSNNSITNDPSAAGAVSGSAAANQSSTAPTGGGGQPPGGPSTIDSTSSNYDASIFRDTLAGGTGAAAAGPRGPPATTSSAANTAPAAAAHANGTANDEKMTLPEMASLDKPLRSLPITKEDEAAFERDYARGKGLTVDDFDLLKVVGKGSFGKVMQVKKRDSNKIYAMKVLKKQQLIKRKQVAHTKTERKVLEEIDNPFIVALRFAFQTDTKLYMVLDYFMGGELFYHLKNGGRFTEERGRFYAAEIALALQCLHDQTIVYRDLKPENVLLDEEGHIRLTDFGLSKEGVSNTKLTHTFCGTPEYLAPEVIHGQGYGTAVDWWSLGTLLFEMLTGLPPFYNQNLHVMYEKIVRGKLTFPAYLSSSARSVLTGLLTRDPKLRLGARGGIEDLKRHPFFDGLDWDKLYRKEIIPPFKPAVTEGKMDTSYVDEEFKKETPKDTPDVASNTLRQKVKFENFTFAGPESNLDRSGGLDASPSSEWEGIVATLPSAGTHTHPALDLAPTSASTSVGTTTSAPASGAAGPSLLGAQLRAQGKA